MLVPKNDKLRHSILGLLIEQKSTVKKQTAYCHEIALSVDDLAKKLNVSPQEIRNAVGLMVIAKEVEYCQNAVGLLFNRDEGFVSYQEEKYIVEGKERVKKKIDFFLKFTAPIALIVSIYNACTTQSKQQADKQELRRMQQQINEIKGKLPNPIRAYGLPPSNASKKP